MTTLTTEEIIKMWKKSGDLEFLVMPYNKIEDFARLVYAKATEREREACAELCKNFTPTDEYGSSSVADIILSRGEA